MSSESVYHPAAEIVAIALRKICKVANSRKYAKLHEECRLFLDELHLIIPAAGTAGGTRLLIYGRAGAGSAVNLAGQSGHPSRRASNDGQQQAVSPADDTAAAKSLVPDAGEAHSVFREADDVAIRGGAAAEPDMAGGEGGDQHPHSTSLTPRLQGGGAGPGPGPDPGREGGIGKPPQSAQPHAVDLDLPDLVPRTDTALPDPVCDRIIGIFGLAVDTMRPEVIDVALDCIQKLVAFRFLQGAVYVVNTERAATGREGDEAGGGEMRQQQGDAAARQPQAQAIDLICRCDEIPDDKVELHILKNLLTATTSTTFTVHGQALLLAVRTCYNIFLMSRSEVNQQTAKATLTQMLNVVFQRMEADSVYVEVRPILVTDVLGLPRANPQDTGSLTSVVQTFLNNVVMVTAGMQAQQPNPEDVRSSVSAAVMDPRLPSVLGTGAATGARTASTANLTLLLPPSTSVSGADLSEDGSAAATTGAVAVRVSAESAAASDGSGTDTPRFVADAASRTAILQRDAFLVFRALCKLSIRTNDNATANDPTSVRGKVLALELVKVLLENSGPVFRRADKFLSAIRQYLCLSLLKNSASPLPSAQTLSVSIFMSLLSRFRTSLKAEVGVFFPMILLKPFEGSGPVAVAPGAAPQPVAPLSTMVVQHRAVVLRCLRDLCRDGQLLLDLFVNFDCDLESSNLFERLVNSLVRQAQLPVQASSGNLSGLGGLGDGSSTLVTAEQGLRQDALLCLVNAMEAIWTWYRQASDLAELGGPAAGITRRNLAAVPGGATGASDDDGALDDADLVVAAAAAAAAASGGDLVGGGAAGGGGPDRLVAKRAYKLKFQQGIALFNKKPKKGVEFLQREGMLGSSPEEVAAFLTRTEGLEKTVIGDYLGERDDGCIKVMHAFVDAMDFTNMDFDAAIRAFLQGFRLPGEAQKIDRLMEKFAERFVKCNPGSFKSADVAYVLAYSVIMLNTDAHNPQVKSKMSKAAFLKNNRGINDGADLTEEFMAALYERIVTNEIKMKDEGGAGSGAGATAPQEAGGLAAPARALFNTLVGLMGGRGQAVSSGPSDAAIRATLDYLHQRAASATTVPVIEPDAVRPLMEVIWAPLLGALSTLYDEYNDPKLVTVCMGGVAAAACLSAQTGMNHLRDVFLNALCNFTHLHSPATMRYKNALAFKYLLRVAETVGDQLQERWVDVLRCISRWELLQQIASGMPTDAALFRAPEDNRVSIKAAAAALGAKIRTVASELHPLPESFFHSSSIIAASAVAAAAQSAAIISRQSTLLGGTPSSLLSLSSTHTAASSALVVHEEANIKKVHIGGSAMFGQASRGGLSHHTHHHSHGYSGDCSEVPAEVINSVDSGDLNRVFLNSGQLNSEAIVEFVKALTAVSASELRDSRAPRVFSLTKIVEVAHFNMTRIRLVWSRIWAVLSEYFIGVGCHANLSLAMYAVDALRQLAMKFLERDELANYTFQNDFLRPFVVVMRQSQAVEIRELIIRCLSQMILARVTNVKSGWKSMFMVFTTAANDRDPMIVRLAFDTIEKIVREHFTHITETETTTFTDCVNCLIAFTNNPHSLDVALNSIAFLRFCAMKLAEGAIGDVNMLPEGTLQPSALQHHPLRVVAIDANPERSTSFARDSSGTGGAVAGSERPLGRGRVGGTGSALSDSLSRESSDGVLAVQQLASTTPWRGEKEDAEADGGEVGVSSKGEAVAVTGRPRGMSAFGLPAAATSAAVAAASLASGSRFGEDSRSGPPGPPLPSGAHHALSAAGGVGSLSFGWMPSLAERLQGVATAGGSAQLKLRFIDRDEHVYFWFPLLAGLSELTFDPRQEIRHSALEVLFDILRFHGGSFAQSFWVRIFDSVLLPIFDHVRAEVTDTTTFTSEKRRQQEEQWLYETCTRCLQHLVDLFVQFYDEAFTLLSRLLGLLRGFMNRSHQSLAAVGVAAFVRLAVNAGPIMNETCWEEVIAALLALLEETAPDVRELITPPPRLNMAVTAGDPSTSAATTGAITSEITPASAGGSPSGLGQAPGSAVGVGAGNNPRSFTLREGVGARRLAKFRCQAATQLLLVQGCGEVYAKDSQSLPPGAVRGLLDALALIHRHAHAADMDLELRKRLALQQAEDRVTEDKAVSDPPLLRLEVESAAAYLSVNLTITANAGQVGASPDSVALASLTNAQERLVQLCLTTLARYTLGVRYELPYTHGLGSSAGSSTSTINHVGGVAAHGPPHDVSGTTPTPPRDRPWLLSFLPGRGSSGSGSSVASATHSAMPQPRYIVVGRTGNGAPVLMAPPAVEFASFSPLALSSLVALGELEEATFRRYLGDLFPLLTQLIRADYAPPDVHRALSTLFSRRVQPMVLAATADASAIAAVVADGGVNKK